MKRIFEMPEDFDWAVSKTAATLIARFGKRACEEAWKIARKPNLTRSERAYCVAVAQRVARQITAVAQPV